MNDTVRGPNYPFVISRLRPSGKFVKLRQESEKFSTFIVEVFGFVGFFLLIANLISLIPINLAKHHHIVKRVFKNHDYYCQTTVLYLNCSNNKLLFVCIPWFSVFAHYLNNSLASVSAHQHWFIFEMIIPILLVLLTSVLISFAFFKFKLFTSSQSIYPTAVRFYLPL